MAIDRYRNKYPLSLEALAIDMPVMAEDHPNRAPFTGVLTRLDEASTRPPNGSDGHRVLITSDVAHKAIPSLLGMGIDIASNFRDHNKKLKVGVLTGGSVKGKDLVVEGHIFSKDFPDEYKYIKSHKNQLGMSYEIADVQVIDTAAPVWELSSFIFTGAAILEKRAAAYQDTSIAASLQSIDSLDEFFAHPEIANAFADYLLTAQCMVIAYQKGKTHGLQCR